MKLYQFQKEMVDRFVTTPSILCGDEMGTGKTVEALALDLRRRTTLLNGQRQTDFKTLVVSPLSVASSWERHIHLMWPGARVFVIDPKNRPAFIEALKQRYHYYVLHWEGLRLIDELQDVKWWHIIADEVHRAKSKKAQQTVALKKQKATYKTGLSGTPADNHPQDLWSVLHWLYPGQWASQWNFNRRYVMIQTHTSGGGCTAVTDPENWVTCGKNHKHSFRKVIGVGNVDELHDRIRDYYIRRTKKEVLPQLPAKYYSTIEVELPPKQRRIYKQMQKDMLAWVGKHEEEPIAAPMVIAQLTRLKQFALGYAELVPAVRKRRDCKSCDGDCVGHNVELVRLTEPSAKLDALMELLEDNPDEQIVVFSESKQIINLLEARLRRAGITHGIYTGDTSPDDRTRIVDEFQRGAIRVFAGTITAGGEGITLTAANTVVFLDRTWNPSKNRQAEDRLHRIGQQNSVHVIDIVAKDTVDRGRLQMLKLKWSWLKAMLGDKKAEEEEDEGDYASAGVRSASQ
jgi:SNF2 family DNA or RNA helicase